MQFENLLLTKSNGILYITINRESKLNALNIKTIEEIREAIQLLYDDNEVKSAIISGAGQKAFVAGADISEISRLDTAEAEKFALNGQAVFAKIQNCPKPVIAAVNGFALGGGCELAMSCHMIVAAENARFGQPEVNLGVIPGYGGTQRLTELVGRNKAIELMLTADMINAQEAKELGLVNHVVPQEQVIAKAEEILTKVNSKAPIAIAEVIRSVNAYGQGNGYAVEAQSFGNCTKSNDFKEGTSAFLEKRKANFKGN